MKRFTFNDYYNNEVQLAFENHPFSKLPKHVWVICTYNNQWLLTLHPRRGIEFPGGKVEKGETAKEAAIREVFEETGASVDDIHYVAQYRVNGKAGMIIKNVYFANIKKLEKQDSYFETEGPVILERLPDNIKQQRTFSFMMKDDVLVKSLHFIKEQGLLTFE
ncbi:nucleoside triphosphatase YtkD [Lottiidibacillus patelloidae]|uniref:Nucleoside triphosphatase YtkD n=1 Tax=Lottiidibacillus patelloidae TaxID=2670334 RepID=A0A263BRD7_9BACI|nr:nucleoside triphosphatase YtkD [Lottiidibacillus patelloidae]OZM56142.1 nucleoside triphosphatase YtkD [Lottiidibacillus patelloidae]